MFMLSISLAIGCVIKKCGEIISAAHNRREEDEDVTSHAEILAIKQAEKKLGTKRLRNCTMFATLEPCPMCAGAIINSRIKNVYFGAFDMKNGAVVSKARLFDTDFTHKPNFEGGVLESECSVILTDFFKRLRKSKE